MISNYHKIRNAIEEALRLGKKDFHLCGLD